MKLKKNRTIRYWATLTYEMVLNFHYYTFIEYVTNRQTNKNVNNRKKDTTKNKHIHNTQKTLYTQWQYNNNRKYTIDY